MIRFESDYLEGAHPAVLELLERTNMQQTPGYGMDPWCEKARGIIRELCGLPEADVYFLVGGTQTNAAVIDALLRPVEGVICADTGHINVHETGAVESTRHKVIGLPHKDGKITAAQVEEKYLADGFSEHVVRPAMVYISFPTEYGTIYSKEELTGLYGVCRKHGLPLFIDGARLGYGLAAKSCDLTLKELARLCDVFYIGGTKVGALFGEAVVFTNPSLGKDFRYFIKNHGGMLAKGRLLGIQFAALLEDGLYFDIAARGVREADRIREALAEKGIPLYVPNDTNQVFCLLTEEQHEKLTAEFSFDEEGRPDGERYLVRMCTGWATLPENTGRLTDAIRAL
jgi:threonine aldolase